MGGGTIGYTKTHIIVDFPLENSYISTTVFYPVPNRIYVRVFCDLYKCIWLHFLSIVELTNYSCTKH